MYEKSFVSKLKNAALKQVVIYDSAFRHKGILEKCFEYFHSMVSMN